ncbi:MAG: carbohydrate kinase [Lachnospiraceae bacterium]
MFDVTALGEVLIDFTPSGLSQSGQRLFEQNPGGAPANVLTALANCGLKTAMIGKVGDDMHGIFLQETLKKVGIDCTGLLIDPQVFTTLAFVALSDSGDRTFSFARKPGADTMLTAEEVEQHRSKIEESRILHVGSLSLTAEPSRAATFRALQIARDQHILISYDPNYRAPLWDSEQEAIKEMRAVIPYVDVMKMSDEETELLTGIKDPKQAAQALMQDGVSLVAVTLGAQGAYVACAEGGMLVPGFKSRVVDTTGAGDSFWGGFLYSLLESGKSPKAVTLKEAVAFARFGNATAGLCVEKRGGIPAIPFLSEIRNLLASQLSGDKIS